MPAAVRGHAHLVLLLPLLLPALLGRCLGAARTALPSSQSKSFWDQIKANNEQRKPSRPDGDPALADLTGGPHQPSPSLREVLESKKAKRNMECRPDYCYRAAQQAGGGASATAAGSSSNRICGNDGKTYESRCMLQFLRRCHGQKVKVRHLGACGAPIGPVGDGLSVSGGSGSSGGGIGFSGGQARQSCQQSRLRALSQSSRGEQVIYVPQCRRDGNFRRVQCNYQLKYCFCVRKRSGKPLPGTGVQLPNRPLCNRRQRRKKPQPQLGGERRQQQQQLRPKQQQQQQQPQQKKRKDRRKGGGVGDPRKNRCSSRQRAQFNRNILKQFEIEFNASVTSRGGVGGMFKPKRGDSGGSGGLPIHGVVEKTLQQPERRSAEWKFSELDANSDGQLSYRETKALRKVTRTNIKPKGCARRFFSTCDLNSNKRLERAEWILCFGLENAAATAEESASTDADAQPATKSATVGVTGTAAYTAPAELGLPPLDDVGISGAAVVRAGGGSAGGKGSLMELVSRPRKRKRAKESRPFAHKSCPLAREEALEKNRQLLTLRQRQVQRTQPPGAEMSVFVPECTAEGKYAKRQCHSDTSSDRLCFCMDPNTGQVLKSRGGDVGAAGVDCESAHLRARAAAGFRGCSQTLLHKFATQLTDLMVQETRDAWTPQDRHLSVEARSLRLRFQRADVNRDARLDRNEQKWWRRDLKARWKASPRELRPTKRCAANFLRFCDADRDAAVTLPELQACLGLPAA